MHLLPMEGNLRAALSELQGRFLPITEATFWSDHVGEPRQQAVLVAVNHRRAQILAPHKVRDPWSDVDGPDRPAAAEPSDPVADVSEGADAAGATLDPWRVEPPPPPER